jgi:hypothetical protein
LHDLKTLFQGFSSELGNSAVDAIYLYGSQVDLIGRFGLIPKGKEIDLVFIKHGRLSDGEMPISIELAEKLFSPPKRFVYTFNGVWGKNNFDDDYYFFDILGEGSENIREGLPSAKVFSLKGKILVWGGDVCIHKVSISEYDKTHLTEVMSKYVRREFFKKDSPQNRKSIYKNGLFILSLNNESLLKEGDRQLLIKLIKSSPFISKAAKKNLDCFIQAYDSGSFNELCEIFNQLVEMNE